MGKCFSEFHSEEKKENVDRENIQKTYDELKNLNSDELSARLFDEVKKQKESGSFDFEKLSESIEQLRPFISQSTYENMKNLLGKIK